MKPRLTLLLLISSTVTMSQTITPWTEQNGTLGLGYPVPIPVDTTEPFDGFRTYTGLFAKHQTMAMNNEYITGHIVGQSHYNRDIWAYQLSDADNTTRYGAKEGAMMVNGGIHAREWQSPETLTQIITDFHDNSDDNSFYQYLLENTDIITIPVNNVDGFLQTQRYPTENWFSNNIGPRDGRMRRKNLLDTDENLTTQNDFLNGVDLNRNNNPYWATTLNFTNPRSSNDPTSIVYHGAAVHSEPETQARLNAADLVDVDQLRIYTDVHSFSQVHFANRSFNNNLNTLQTRVLADFTNHHSSYSAGKVYVDRSAFTTPGFGIGATDEYFQTTYQIPSWTLEIEPSGNLNPDAHPNLPGNGADYGGFVNNGHDGFILPESEIKRVREELAKSFMVAWYGQAGPPSITQLRIVDKAANTIVFDAEWDIQTLARRSLHTQYFDQIVPDREYSLVLRFDKPMRDRNSNDQIVNLQGQSLSSLEPFIFGANAAGDNVELNLQNGRWINEKTATSWESYGYYKDDTYVVDFSIDPAISTAAEVEMTWRIVTTDMVGQSNDANPATVVTWAGGQWQNYEDASGNSSINGGLDETITINVTQQDNQAAPALPLTALYYDVNRSGEGFSIEFLNEQNEFWMQWFTYDSQGQQQWYVDRDAAVANNAIMAREIFTVNGGVFGPDFNPDDTQFEIAGDLEIIFDEGVPIDNTWINRVRTGAMKYTYPDGRKFRAQLTPLTAPRGFTNNGDFDPLIPPGLFDAAAITGSWYNRQRDGEGYHIHVLDDGRALLQWYGFGPNGEKMWFNSDDGVITETDQGITIEFSQVYFAEGGVFGADFDTNAVELTVWGSATFELSCAAGTISYQSDLPGYGSGIYSVEPLTRPINNVFTCDP